MDRIRALVVAALALLSVPWGSAQAGVSINIGLPLFHPWHHHYCGPRVYVAPAPVVVAPRPVYVVPAPAPVYVQPAPAVVQAPAAPTAPPPAPPRY